MKPIQPHQVFIRLARPLRGSGEIPNGLGIAQLWPTLNAPSMRPVVHSTLKRWRERLAAMAAWAMEMYCGAGLDIFSQIATPDGYAGIAEIHDGNAFTGRAFPWLHFEKC